MSSADMLETPPGYPFEEIDYVDIEVEEVSNKLAISTFDWNVRDPMMQKFATVRDIAIVMVASSTIVNRLFS